MIVLYESTRYREIKRKTEYVKESLTACDFEIQDEAGVLKVSVHRACGVVGRYDVLFSSLPDTVTKEIKKVPLGCGRDNIYKR